MTTIIIENGIFSQFQFITRTKISDLTEPHSGLNLTLIARSKHMVKHIYFSPFLPSHFIDDRYSLKVITHRCQYH